MHADRRNQAVYEAKIWASAVRLNLHLLVRSFTVGQISSAARSLTHGNVKFELDLALLNTQKSKQSKRTRFNAEGLNLALRQSNCTFIAATASKSLTKIKCVVNSNLAKRLKFEAKFY